MDRDADFCVHHGHLFRTVGLDQHSRVKPTSGLRHRLLCKMARCSAWIYSRSRQTSSTVSTRAQQHAAVGRTTAAHVGLMVRQRTCTYTFSLSTYTVLPVSCSLSWMLASGLLSTAALHTPSLQDDYNTLCSSIGIVCGAHQMEIPSATG